MSMRIISGKYKGRQLHSAKDQSIRPTTDKIKEYIFELLGDFVSDAITLDLFCGSGSLGLEALSRGARNVTFLDNSQTSLRVLRRNISLVKLDESFRIIRKEAEQFLKKNKQPFDLIFADPPFKWDKFDALLPLVFKPENLTEFGLFVLESERSHEIKWEGETYEVLRQKEFDRSVITFFSRKGAV
ncbi:MAG: 16S rRNA (guanine(966)-N(2))-methyltransferase RsmD [Calditrichaceae bacterium]|nr:16S rRNA (guanine(966)-N(2))-methyltransferase RsmD [Calditrichia bacterium]NUQ42412.1 16S rRNA (guanine(966)-N(2))-methyltransferase RsmD [Calditrichaceae bacterium]